MGTEETKVADAEELLKQIFTRKIDFSEGLNRLLSEHINVFVLLRPCEHEYDPAVVAALLADERLVRMFGGDEELLRKAIDGLEQALTKRISVGWGEIESDPEGEATFYRLLDEIEEVRRQTREGDAEAAHLNGEIDRIIAEIKAA